MQTLHKLEFHTLEWKKSEVALFRRVFGKIGKPNIDSIRMQYAQQKLQHGLIELDSAELISSSTPRYLLHSMTSGITDYFIKKSKEYLSEKIIRWHEMERLPLEKAEKLLEYLSEPKTREYLKDIGAHIIGSALSPPIIGDVIFGFFASLAIVTNNPYFLIPGLVMPIASSGFKVSYSAIRFITNGERRKSHAIATLGGLIPKFGNLIYYIPQTMVAARTEQEISELGKFLFYHSISKIAQNIPIFG